MAGGTGLRVAATRREGGAGYRGGRGGVPGREGRGTGDVLGIRSGRTDLAGGPRGPLGNAGRTAAERREPPWTGRGSRAGLGVCGARPSVLGAGASLLCRGLCPSLGVRRDAATPEAEWLKAVHEASDQEATPVDVSSWPARHCGHQRGPCPAATSAVGTERAESGETRGDAALAHTGPSRRSAYCRHE